MLEGELKGRGKRHGQLLNTLYFCRFLLASRYVTHSTYSGEIRELYFWLTKLLC